MELSDIVEIEVTQEDIDLGKKNNCRECPVALAVKRKLPGLQDILIGDGLGLIIHHQRNWTLGFPQSTKDFIKAFDSRLPVEPFSFQLTLKETQ